MEILTAKDLTFKYPNAARSVLDGVSFGINEGEFVLLCGPTGCGKSTLLRLLKRELAPQGDISGEILYMGSPQSKLDPARAASEIGFVMQRPEEQIATDKVWHELALGLENIGTPPSIMRRKIAEMAGYFGITAWFESDTQTLSGGQKQLLNLASIMAMSPRILLLDEPTSQLDPIAASEFVNTLVKLNRELSLTIIIAEHRLEELFPVSDRVLALDEGELVCDLPQKEAASVLSKLPRFAGMLPTAARIYGKLGCGGKCPLTVKEGRAYLRKNAKNDIRSFEMATNDNKNKAPALEMNEVYLRYLRDGADILAGTSLKISEGEIFSLLGANGSGKTTVLSAVSGLRKPYAGKIKIFGKKQKDYTEGTLYRNCLALLPQDPQILFVKNTVVEELAGCESEAELVGFDLENFAMMHPYDLSGGEAQLAALSKVLASKPRLLLMDEPTKGLDADSRTKIKDALIRLREDAVTVFIVTHDAEFAAEVSDRCGLFFRGEVVSSGTPTEFFSENSFYTTGANRISRDFYDGAVTVDDVLALIKLNSEGES